MQPIQPDNLMMILADPIYTKELLIHIGLRTDWTIQELPNAFAQDARR